MLVKLFYTCMCFLCNSRFKSSLELMLCVIDTLCISTLNKTYLNLFGILVLLLVIIGAIFNYMYLDFVCLGIAKKSLKKPKG